MRWLNNWRKEDWKVEMGKMKKVVVESLALSWLWIGFVNVIDS